MIDLLKSHPLAIGFSLLLHAVIIGLMVLNFAFNEKTPAVNSAPPVKTVKAEVIDVETLDQLAEKKQQEQLRKVKAEQAKQKKATEKKRKEEAALKKKAEQKKKAAAEKKKKIAEAKKAAAQKKKDAEKKRKAEAEKKKKAETLKQQQAQAAAEKKKAEEEKRKKLEADKEKKLAAEKKRQQELKKAEEAKKKQEAAARLAAEQEQKRREAELRAQQAEEERQSRLNTLREGYILAIRQKIERYWRQPPGSEKVACVLKVIQGPGGIILDVAFGQCSGGTAPYRASIEKAVYKAEPLPKPADPALFERDLNILFNPK